VHGNLSSLTAQNRFIQSYLDCAPHNPIAHFHGTLDIDTLGGAGFASQRTTDEDREWDLSSFEGIEITVVDGDCRPYSPVVLFVYSTSQLTHIMQKKAKRYTFILKDEILAHRPDGREQSGISYEYEFHAEKDKKSVVRIPWGQLKATYRGREKKDVEPLDLKRVKRFSLMMRRWVLWGFFLVVIRLLMVFHSYFAQQKGAFSLRVESISVYKDGKGTDDDREEEDEKDGVFTAYKDEVVDDGCGVDEKDMAFSSVGSASARQARVERRERENQAWSLVGLWATCTDCARRR